MKKTILMLHQAFLDCSFSIEELITPGDKARGRRTEKGTHKSQFGPLPPTGKPFEITIFDIRRFNDEKLVEHCGVPDRMALVEQPGIKTPLVVIMKIVNLFHS